jgi:hypothetical protein
VALLELIDTIAMIYRDFLVPGIVIMAVLWSVYATDLYPPWSVLAHGAFPPRSTGRRTLFAAQMGAYIVEDAFSWATPIAAG